MRAPLRLAALLLLVGCAGLVRPASAVKVVGWNSPSLVVPQMCRNHTPVVGLQSIYGANTSLRTWAIRCRSPPTGPPFLRATGLYHTHTLQQRDSTTSCPNNTFLSGLSTHQHYAHWEDEETLLVSCASLPAGYSLEHCGWSRWLNRAGENFTVPWLPLPWVVRSVTSKHLVMDIRAPHAPVPADDCVDNCQLILDWRYKLELCQFTGSSALYPSNRNNCTLPSVPHGRVKDISHTHSITDSHAPFKIKISLTCDPGYYWNETKTIAICENGTWTRFPPCTACSRIDYCAETQCSYSTHSKCLRCLPSLPDGLPLVLSDSGTRCRALPVIDAGPLMSGFVAGSNLSLDCQARGRPTPSISWHRVLLPNEERVPLLDHTHFMTHQNGSLTIVNVSDVDSGPYVCRAWNAAGSDCVYIDVYNMHPPQTGPPSIHHWCPLHVVSSSPEHRGTPSHLHCHTHGFPPPIITWTRLNTTSSHHHSFHTLTSPNVIQYQNGTLEFQPVRNEDTALYRCEATNLFGTVTMETILFANTSASDKPHPLLVSHWASSYTAREGSPLAMSCSVSAHSTLLWMKKGGLVSTNGTRVQQTGNGTLLLETVCVEDQGPYWCVAWNEDDAVVEKTELIVIGQSLSGSIPFQHSPVLTPAALLITWVLHNMLSM